MAGPLTQTRIRGRHRCWAEIDFHALRHNLQSLRHYVGTGQRILTVVKADAYGHGLSQTAALLMQAGTDAFAVANLSEAHTVRLAGPGWPVLMLGPCLPEEIETAVREDIMVTISSPAEVERFAREARGQQRVARLHLKVDTGMGRLGAPPRQVLDLIELIQRHAPWVSLAGVYSHYASIENDAEYSRRQRRRFAAVLNALSRRGIGLDYVHMANSGGLIFESGWLGNAVRPGLLVYGVLPPGRRPLAVPWTGQIRPVLSLKCRVGFVKQIAKGTTLGYGRRFRAPRKMKVATLTAGYGDGFARTCNRYPGQVLIQGHRCPILGSVTMDQTLADISHLPEVTPGNEVVLIGHQMRETISATELADWSGSIPWEILTGITYRVPRLYLGGQAS